MLSITMPLLFAGAVINFIASMTEALLSASFKRLQIWWDCDRKQVVIISNDNRRCHDAAPEPERSGSGDLASLARHCRAILLNAAQSGFKAEANIALPEPIDLSSTGVRRFL